jgi:catechol 2,3-dioxygenase-like lactoylglutathione lyase family enzyme
MKGRIDHVGIIVDDIEATREFLERVTGMSLSRRGDIPATQTRTAFLGYGPGAQVELVELGNEAARAARLGDGQARVEHVAIEVDDLEAAAAELRSMGVAFQSDTPSVGGPLRSLFSRPETTRGFVLQFFDRNLG